MGERQKEIARRAKMVADNFQGYLEVFDHKPPFTGAGQLALHREAISLRRQLGSAGAALASDEFLWSVYRTLQAWGIGKKGSKLRAYEHFAGSLRDHCQAIEELDGLCIDDVQLDVDGCEARLWQLIQSLDLVANDAKLVAHSKALHHLLPELLPPIDRAWTGSRFFRLHSPEMQYHQEKWFSMAWAAFTRIAGVAKPVTQVTGLGWRTSRSKLLDNALIGYCLTHNIKPAS